MFSRAPVSTSVARIVAATSPRRQAIVRPEHAKAVAYIVERRVELLYRCGGVLVRRRARGMTDASPRSQQVVNDARKSG
jgi:hypothetical protein